MPDALITLDDAGFEEVVGGSSLFLVDFWAPWCGPCVALEPILTELAGEFPDRLSVGRLDVEAHPARAARYAVTSVPTLIPFRDGKPLKRLPSSRSKRHILEGLRDVLDA